jgi:hypothetical protein
VNEEEIKKYKKLFEKLKESRMVKYGSPDQFQWRQNELLQEMADFIMIPYYQWEHEQDVKRQEKLEKWD